jgi:uncharacterized membrane protein SirB2
MLAYYPWLKLLHVGCAVASLGLFLLRGWWRWRGSPWRDSAWVRRVPHVNDTLLLLAGLSMAALLGLNPLREAWLTAKIVGLAVHVLLGLLALRAGLVRWQRGAAWAGSLAAFGYVVAVAMTRDASPWA